MNRRDGIMRSSCVCQCIPRGGRDRVETYVVAACRPKTRKIHTLRETSDKFAQIQRHHKFSNAYRATSIHSNLQTANKKLGLISRTDLKGRMTYNGLNMRISRTDPLKYQVKCMCGVHARMFISMKCELALVSASLGDTP